MKKKGLIYVVLLVSLFNSNILSAKEKVYKLATVNWVGWSPANVADVKGFWKKEGVNVKVFVMPTIKKRDYFFENGLSDLTYFMLGESVRFYMDGVHIKVLSELNWSHGGDKIVIKKKMNFSKFKNRVFAIYQENPAVTYFLNNYFLANGLKYNDFKIKAIDSERLATLFTHANLKGILAWEPYASKAVNEGNGKIVATTADYPGCMPEGLGMLKPKYDAMPKEDLKKIIKGLAKAAEWCNNPKNWKEYQTILNEKTFPFDKPFSEKELKDMVASVRIHNIDTLLKQNKKGGNAEVYYKKLREFLKENGKLKKDFKVENIFDSKITMEALEELKKDKE